MEKRDLYDINRKKTGEYIFKGDPLPKDRYILIVVSFIQNSEDKFLIQKASSQFKDGKYASTGGHAKSGETPIQAIISEVKEELNLDISKDNIQFFHTEYGENVFFDLFYIQKDFDINALTLQKEEVELVKWLTIDEINQLIENGEFRKSHAEAFKKCLIYLKEKNN